VLTPNHMQTKRAKNPRGPKRTMAAAGAGLMMVFPPANFEPSAGLRTLRAPRAAS
jgi:hypothetical protein